MKLKPLSMGSPWSNASVIATLTYIKWVYHWFCHSCDARNDDTHKEWIKSVLEASSVRFLKMTWLA